MALSGVYVITAPAAAAAMGLYFLGRNNFPNNYQEVGGAGGIGAAASVRSKKEVKSGGEGPKLAPQFDGLHCFETIVPK